MVKKVNVLGLKKLVYLEWKGINRSYTEMMVNKSSPPWMSSGCHEEENKICIIIGNEKVKIRKPKYAKNSVNFP